MPKPVWRAACTEQLCCRDAATLHPKHPDEDGVRGWVGSSWSPLLRLDAEMFPKHGDNTPA